MDEFFLILFDSETGERLETYPIDSDITDEKKEEMIARGFEVVPREDWNKLVGNYDGQEWIKDVVHGGYIPKPPYIPELEEAKEIKIKELKKIRDEKEVEPILVNGHLFDYDDKARERINAAIIALDISQGSITWTLADNTDTVVTANDLRLVIATVANRSNQLHIHYRDLKEQVEQARTNEEVEAIIW